MKGKYKTKEGDIMNVESFDHDTKMAYVHLGSGQYRWYNPKDYADWEKVPNPFENYFPEENKSVTAKISEESVTPINEIYSSTTEDKPKRKTTQKK